MARQPVPLLQSLVEAVLARDPLEGLRSAVRLQVEEALVAQVRLHEDELTTVRRQLRGDITQLTSKVVTGLLPVLNDEATLRRAAAGLVPERTIQGLLSAPLAVVAGIRVTSVVMPVNLVKGLEFDGCIVAGADAAHYGPDMEHESRLLYVSTSRGMHALAPVAEEKLHPLLS